MTNQFFEKPILNSPYGYPACQWELDKTGKPTQYTLEKLRPDEFIMPIPAEQRHMTGVRQAEVGADYSESYKLSWG